MKGRKEPEGKRDTTNTEHAGADGLRVVIPHAQISETHSWIIRLN